MPRPYEALRYRDFRRLWLAQLLSQTGSQMQVVAINWHVYLLTKSPLALGFVGLTRVLPIVAFSLWGGVLADRADRRRVMLASQSAMTAVSVALAAFAFLRRDSVAVIYVLNAVQASATSFDNPARQALVPRLVPIANLPGALALNLTMFQAATIAGPALAGAVLAGASAMPAFAGTSAVGLIYALNAVSFLFVLAALLGLRTPTAPEAGDAPQEPPLRALRSGLRFVFTTPLMVSTMTLDFVATFFSGAMSLLPIVADQVLHVGPSGYGWLAAAPATGALLGSLYTSVRPLPRRQGIALLWAVGAYGAATIVYGLSRSYLLTFLALAGTGLADVLSTVIRQTLRQLITPDALRGRMTAVNMIFFLGGPQLGELEAGLVASWFAPVAFGVTLSIVSGGVITIATAAAVAAALPVVRRYEGGRAAGG
ncbi:MAG TPA: MFS transporter [Vicinamibacteria bacterium]|nr:MFS transporter [Vicinamibacteria bacterium]